MAIYPKAKQLLIEPGPNDPRVNCRIGILHVDGGNAPSLYKFFSDRSGGIESHFHIPKVAQLEQYRDTAYEADANYKANPFAMSVETQGYADEPWNAKQIQDIKDLMLWARDVEGIPLRKVTSWNDTLGGWGYHIMMGTPGMWTPVAKSCPGPLRIKQFNEILVPWMVKVASQDARTYYAKPVPPRWNNFTHLTPYAYNNSLEGIQYAAKTNKRIDLDFLISVDNVWVNTHWPELDREGFRYTRDSFKQGHCRYKEIGRLTGKRVDQCSWSMLSTLETKSGYRMQSGRAAMTRAAHYKVDVEIEPKCLIPKELWLRMQDNCVDAYGPTWKRHVVAKMLPQFAWRRTLSRAKSVGFTTMRLRVTNPRYMPKYIDYYRR